MRIVDFEFSSDSRQYSVGRIEERICKGIILRSETLSFHYSPKCFHNVQMWGIWRDIKKEKPSLFPTVYTQFIINFAGINAASL